MPDQRDAYGILGVPSHANKPTIERAYRKLARRYHPDLNTSPDATARMQDINWARDTLVDSHRRRFYDRGRRGHYSHTRAHSSYTSTQQRTSHTYTPPHARAGRRQYTARTRPATKAQPDTSWGVFAGVIVMVVALLTGALGEGDSSSDSYPRFPHESMEATIAAIVGDFDVSSSGPSGGSYSATTRSADMIWNKIDSPAKRAHYQQILDDVRHGIDVQEGGYIGRRKPFGAARYYCPPDPVHGGLPLYFTMCTVFYSQAGDVGEFDG